MPVETATAFNRPVSALSALERMIASAVTESAMAPVDRMTALTCPASAVSALERMMASAVTESAMAPVDRMTALTCPASAVSALERMTASAVTESAMVPVDNITAARLLAMVVVASITALNCPVLMFVSAEPSKAGSLPNMSRSTSWSGPLKVLPRLVTDEESST